MNIHESNNKLSRIVVYTQIQTASGIEILNYTNVSSVDIVGEMLIVHTVKTVYGIHISKVVNFWIESQ